MKAWTRRLLNDPRRLRRWVIIFSSGGASCGVSQAAMSLLPLPYSLYASAGWIVSLAVFFLVLTYRGTKKARIALKEARQALHDIERVAAQIEERDRVVRDRLN